MTDFWSSVTVVAVALLAIGVVEAFERWRQVMWPDHQNHHVEERERQLNSLRLASRFPPAKGPKSFAASEVFHPDRRARVQPIRKERVN